MKFTNCNGKCRYCDYDPLKGNYFCYSEKGIRNFEKAINNFVLPSGSLGLYPTYKFPDQSESNAFLVFAFNTNEAMERWLNHFKEIVEISEKLKNFEYQEQEQGQICRKEICGLCQHCSFVQLKNNFVCHNEKSNNFGKILPVNIAHHWGCSDFEIPGWEKMSFEQALYFIATAYRDMYHMYSGLDYNFACVVFTFSTNDALDTWRNAFVRIAMDVLK